MSELESKKKNKKWIIFVIIGVVLIAGIVLGTIFISRAVKTTRSANQLELGNKYLDELDYEEAIAHYNQAIAIDPTNLDAYIGIYNAYNALADQAVADLDFGLAVKYYDEALRILKDGQEYIDSDELNDMIDDMRDKKKDAKAKRDGEEPDSGNTGIIPGSSSLSDSEIAELTDTLNNSLNDTTSDYRTMLFAMATQIASDMKNGTDYFNISGVLAGDISATASFLLPTVDVGAAYDYSADWCNHYYYEDSGTGCMIYALPISEAVSAAYSISGKNIDFTSYTGIESYNGEDCLTRLIGGIGWIGNIFSISSVSDAAYIGDDTWRIVLTVHDSNSGDYGMAYDYDYCDVSYYLKPDALSHFGFIITGYETTNTQDSAWIDLYTEFLYQYKNTQSGWYSDYVTYDIYYFDSDDIPELVISSGGECSYYVYTVRNNSVEPYNCANYDDISGDNFLFVASWVGGTSGDLAYVPYSGKLLITHVDSDYAGQVYYMDKQYYDGAQWYDVESARHFTRDQNGDLGPDVQNSIANGWMTDEEYDNVYDAPGYDSDLEWVVVSPTNYLRDFY